MTCITFCVWRLWLKTFTKKTFKASRRSGFRYIQGGSEIPGVGAGTIWCPCTVTCGIGSPSMMWEQQDGCLLSADLCRDPRSQGTISQVTVCRPCQSVPIGCWDFGSAPNPSTICTGSLAGLENHCQHLIHRNHSRPHKDLVMKYIY